MIPASFAFLNGLRIMKNATSQNVIYSYSWQLTKTADYRSGMVVVILACSRLRDGGGKSFSNKKGEKRAGAGETGYVHSHHDTRPLKTRLRNPASSTN